MIFDDEETIELSAKQKLEMLFERQKQTLDSFPERKAITKEQYDKSLKTLKEKMDLSKGYNFNRKMKSLKATLCNQKAVLWLLPFFTLSKITAFARALTLKAHNNRPKHREFPHRRR